MATAHQQLRAAAETGGQQVQRLLVTTKEILDTYSNLQPTPQAQQQLQELQATYLSIADDIRATLRQCQQLQSQEAAAAETAAAAAAAAARGEDAAAAAQQEAEAEQLAQLQAQADSLRQQLQAKNVLIKQVIDKLRQLLDSFNMCDSHQRHLLQHAVQFAGNT